MSQELLNIVLTALREQKDAKSIAVKATNALKALDAIEQLYRAFERSVNLSAEKSFINSIVNGVYLTNDFTDEILFKYLSDPTGTVNEIIDYLSNQIFIKIRSYLNDLLSAGSTSKTESKRGP